MSSSKFSYFLSPSILPEVKITCLDEVGDIEEIVVLEDSTGIPLEALLVLCEHNFEEWVESK